MRLNSRAKKLAVILLQSAKESNKAQEVHVSLKKIILLLKKDARFRLLLLSKRISIENKTTILRNVLDHYVDQLVIEFLGIISKEFSLELVKHIFKVYEDLYKKEESIVFVTAHLAHTLDDSEIEKLQNKLESSLNKKTELNIEVNRELLGGIKLRIENTFLDASVKNQMNRLRKNLLQS